jgi:hypothetical protein
MVKRRTPTLGLMLGFIVALAAVIAYSSYMTVQIGGLRKLQNDLVDRNRKDSLQLLRIQNDLNSIALGMRDMLDSEDRYPLTAWTAQFHRTRIDLDDAMRLEEGLSGNTRRAELKNYLSRSLKQFWDAMDGVFDLANNGHEDEARTQIRLSLQARQAALSTAVSRLLVENNESEQEAAQASGRHLRRRPTAGLHFFHRDSLGDSTHELLRHPIEPTPVRPGQRTLRAAP